MTSTHAKRPILEYILAVLGLTAAVAVVTWPHARAFTHSVVSAIDPLFSMWRVGWFAHALSSGASIVDANTFHPERGSLLLSDAVFLESAVAAPALWVGVSYPVVYNTLMLAGMVSSGLALYFVARRFDVAGGPAFLGALIFTTAPYRIEHVMHLELQWVTPGILAMYALHRLFTAPSWRVAVSLGLLVAAQFLACVYYTVFLLPIMTALAVAALVPAVTTRPRATVLTSLAYGVGAAVLAGALVLPVARLYIRQGEHVGPRTAEELVAYSATPANYLASPKENVLYGFTSDRLGSGERRLFPGALALAAAALGLCSRRRRLVVAATIVVVVAGVLSLGVNTIVYRTLYEASSILHGLRAPARFAVYTLAGIAMLAALGVEWVMARWRAGRAGHWGTMALASIVLLAEYQSPQRELSRVDMHPPVYEFLRTASPGAVLELPFSPPLSAEPDPLGRVDYDTDYTYWSTRHWKPIVNGYSGYYPPSYPETRKRLEGFPDDTSMAFLASLGVRYVLVHTLYMLPGETARVVSQLTERPQVRPLGTYRDWAGATLVFELPLATADTHEPDRAVPPGQD